jgi:outer membrane protein OmpA-like peptidoglycan-associated protein
MKNNKLILLILICTFFVEISFSQGVRKSLNTYTNLGYLVAAEGLKKKKNLSLENKIKVADSYRLNHDTKNAEFWYRQIIDQVDKPIIVLHYAQVLQSNLKTKEAETYFLMYNNIVEDRDLNLKSVSMVSEELPFMDQDIQIENMKSLNSEKIDFSPTYYQDNLVFVSNRAHDDSKLTDQWMNDLFFSLWTVELESHEADSKPSLLSEDLNFQYHEGPVTFTEDNNKILFTGNDSKGKRVKKNSKGIMKMQIYSAEIKDGVWAKPSALNINTKEFDECHPTISADGKTLIFASDRDGGYGGMDLYIADYTNGQWSKPRNMGEKINTIGNDVFPYLHDDETLYYSSNGIIGNGGLDIYAVKKNDGKVWMNPRNMGEPFNSPMDDFGIVMNKKSSEGYFSSDREGGLGKDDIYKFSMSSKNEKIDNVLLNTSIQNAESEASIDLKSDLVVVEMDSKSTTKSLEDIALEEALKTDINSADEAINSVAITTNEADKNIGANTKHNNRVLGNVSNSSMTTNNETTIESYIFNGTHISVNENLELKNILYDYNKYNITPAASKDLDRVVEFMNRYSHISIELGSHTDSRGTYENNEILSHQRAQSAKQYLVKQGIDGKRIIYRGYGETVLKNECQNNVKCSEEQHQLNRRTEIKVIKN